MIINGVRLKWGFDRLFHKLTVRIDNEWHSEWLEVPIEENEGVRERVTEVIDRLVVNGAIDPDMRTLTIDLSKAQFDEWGIRWESVQ